MGSVSKKFWLIGVLLGAFSGLVYAEDAPLLPLSTPNSVHADAGDLQTFQERTRQVKS